MAKKTQRELMNSANNQDNSLTINDCNWNPVKDGDTVIITQWLSGKWFAIKKWTVVKNVSIYDEGNIEGKIKDIGVMVIKKEFIKKQN